MQPVSAEDMCNWYRREGIPIPKHLEELAAKEREELNLSWQAWGLEEKVVKPKSRLWIVFLGCFVMACLVVFLFRLESEPSETTERICPYAGPCFDVPRDESP